MLKRQIYFCIYLSLSVSLILQASSYISVYHQAVAQQESKFKTYVNTQHGLKIEYPRPTWVVKEGIGGGNIVAFISTVYGVANSMEEYSKNPSRVFHALGIFVKDLSKGFLPISVDNISLENYSKIKLGYLPRLLDISKLDNFTLSGQPGYKIEYTYGSVFNGIQVWTVKDNKAYDIIYLNNVNTSRNNEDFNPTIMRMLESFEIR